MQFRSRATAGRAAVAPCGSRARRRLVEVAWRCYGCHRGGSWPYTLTRRVESTAIRDRHRRSRCVKVRFLTQGQCRASRSLLLRLFIVRLHNFGAVTCIIYKTWSRARHATGFKIGADGPRWPAARVFGSKNH